MGLDTYKIKESPKLSSLPKDMVNITESFWKKRNYKGMNLQGETA